MYTEVVSITFALGKDLTFVYIFVDNNYWMLPCGFQGRKSHRSLTMGVQDFHLVMTMAVEVEVAVDGTTGQVVSSFLVFLHFLASSRIKKVRDLTGIGEEDDIHPHCSYLYDKWYHMGLPSLMNKTNWLAICKICRGRNAIGYTEIKGVKIHISICHCTPSLMRWFVLHNSILFGWWIDCRDSKSEWMVIIPFI